MERKIKNKSLKINLYLLILVLILIIIFSSSCNILELKTNAGYIFKTDPEKAVIDFLKALKNKNPDYIYDNLLSIKDKSNISKDKFKEELNLILTDIDDIEIKTTTYSGYINKDKIVKVIAEFSVKYKNGEVKEYKKYIYLIEENKEWKIVFDKTFI